MNKCRIAMLNMQRIKYLRPILTEDITQVLVLGLVISHIDYCNSLICWSSWNRHFQTTENTKYWCQAWKYTVLVEAQDKLGHQGNTCTYCLIKCQYYWKSMNKDIRKYVANCTLCHREKGKVQAYPLQMMEIPDRPFGKIVIDLVKECKTSNSGTSTFLQ